MITFEGLDENFRFIVLEVESQVKATFDFIKSPSREIYRRIITRDDYVDNLKTIIENKCFSSIHIHTDKTLDTKRVNKIRAIQVICVNLERIADFCVNIAKQMGFLTDQAFISKYNYTDIFIEIEKSLGRLLQAYKTDNMAEALAICKSEHDLDKMYKEQFDRIMAELRETRDPQNLITVLFIFRYLERIGDSLLNIGEALIFSILGERIKIEQFDALQQTLTKSGFSGSISEIDFKSIWGTRSGCRISKVDAKAGKKEQSVDAHGSIFKEGNLEKIRSERKNISRWKEIDSDLVADIFGYHEENDSGSMLLEFLPGCTMDELILTGKDEILDNALFVLEQTLRSIWKQTRQEKAISTNYIRQLYDRLDSVLQVHPEFHRVPRKMGRSSVLSSEELIRDCIRVEEGVSAPFSVLTHGDFNCNNVVYNHELQKLHYIDLYRSRDFDYVQDASVFLVSNFRMPIFDSDMRLRINRVIEQFYSFVQGCASEWNDPTFEARMAFALARSFYTSTRFELNFKFAREMFHRSLFLLEKVYSYREGDWERFKLPTDILYY